MIKDIKLVVSPQEFADKSKLKLIVERNISLKIKENDSFQVIKKSLDARNRNIKFNLEIRVFIDEQINTANSFQINYQNIESKPRVIIVGAGPAGLFAATRLIELGYCPIIIERGKDVSLRKRDIALITREQTINEESNYCFGEGGAGTFSDGKLYTRSNKRGNINRILEIFHIHGASPEILYEAHPHIGTDALPQIIKNMREAIIKCGGEVHFDKRVTDLIIEGNTVKGVKINDTKIIAEAVILATGHSARDIYRLLFEKQVMLENKTFAMGVRVEHSQELIDTIQYHGQKRGDILPAASYGLVSQVNNRGVYSFCMCPGGYIVPSATNNNQIVVNGMSSSRRHTEFANSGIVVEIRPEDILDNSKGILSGLDFQEKFEQLAKANTSSGQIAPAQRLSDFVNNKQSANLPKSSYTPGLHSSDLHKWIPQNISKRLQQGFIDFDKKMKGFLTNEAYIAGVESRTSSPIRVTRNPETFQSITHKGLFPCGEGAGYAGGIVSSAIDGENTADMIAKYINND